MGGQYIGRYQAHEIEHATEAAHQAADDAGAPERPACDETIRVGDHPDAAGPDTAADLDAPVAVFLAAKNSTAARMRVLWWMPRSAAARLCSDPRTSWKSSALHWTAAVDPDARDADWEFVEDRRPEQTAALFAELSVRPLAREEVRERGCVLGSGVAGWT